MRPALGEFRSGKRKGSDSISLSAKEIARLLLRFRGEDGTGNEGERLAAEEEDEDDDKLSSSETTTSKEPRGAGARHDCVRGRSCGIWRWLSSAVLSCSLLSSEREWNNLGPGHRRLGAGNAMSISSRECLAFNVEVEDDDSSCEMTTL